MTRIDDLPASLAKGTLTCCRSCGRLAIFASVSGPQSHEFDRWRCSCGVENLSPTKEG